jgi:hypothetical protein
MFVRRSHPSTSVHLGAELDDDVAPHVRRVRASAHAASRIGALRIAASRIAANRVSSALPLLLAVPIVAAIAACGAPSRPREPKAIDLAVATGNGPDTATRACVEPPLVPAGADRERGIDAFLADRPEEALAILSAAVKADPHDRAAEAFRAASQAKLEALRDDASDDARASTSTSTSTSTTNTSTSGTVRRGQHASNAADPNASLVRVSIEAPPLARAERRRLDDLPAAKVRLAKESEKKNSITDVADWEAKNGLKAVVHHGHNAALPGHVAPTLAGERLRTVFVHSDHAAALYGDTLLITADGKRPLAFDVRAAVSAGRVRFEVMFAQLVGNTLILELAYNGYAKDAGGKTGYATAYDARNGTLLWSSEPLVGNAWEAVISGGSLIVGYGFTAEPDFLFVLDLATGKVEQKLALKSGPELLRVERDRLFVRSYDVDYVFKSATGFAPAQPAILPSAAAADTATTPPLPAASATATATATIGAIDAETRCWVRRATAAIIAADPASLHEAAERLRPLSRDRTLDAMLRREEGRLNASP